MCVTSHTHVCVTSRVVLAASPMKNISPNTPSNQTPTEMLVPLIKRSVKFAGVATSMFCDWLSSSIGATGFCILTVVVAAQTLMSLDAITVTKYKPKSKFSREAMLQKMSLTFVMPL